MFQGFPGDYDSGSRCSSSPSAESQYLSPLDSFGSPAAAAGAAQECSGALGDMPGSFVPTVTAITTSQDLQWLVQPTLISSVAPGAAMAQPPPPPPPPALDPYELPGPSYGAPGMGGGSFAGPPGPAPGRAPRARARRGREETLTPEEEEKRRVRRERNKLAAAKCRNRRRELTDRLQAETDQLEEEKAELESEIAELRKEKERLEFVLVAHAPACKVPFEDIAATSAMAVPTVPSVAAPVSSEVSSPGKAPLSPLSPLPLFLLPQGPFPPACWGPPNATPPAFVSPHPEGASSSSSSSSSSSCGASHQQRSGGGGGGGDHRGSSSSSSSSDCLSSPSLLAL